MAITKNNASRTHQNGNAVKKPAPARAIPQDDVAGSPERAPLVKLTGLWSNGPGKGMAGSSGSARYLVFKNGFKDKETDPDFVLYVTQNKPREEAGSGEGSDSEAPF